MANQDFTPDWFSKPGDSILSLMHRRAVPAASLAHRLEGEMDTLRRLIAGLQSIDGKIAKAISTALGGTPEFWLRRQENYDKALDRAVAAISLNEQADLVQSVLAPTASPRGKMSVATRTKEARVRLAYYNVNSLRAWKARYGHCIDATRFRTSDSFESKDSAVSLWLRAAELEAELAATKPWDPERLREELPKIKRLSLIRQPARLLPKLRSALASVGVAVVILRAPQGCHASGASRFLNREKAMVLLSLRHKSDDHFWFTLLHEIGHLLLHGDQTFIDEEGMPEDKLEKEANEFARECLIPSSFEEEFESLLANRNAVLRFSVALGISPGIVVGQMQHRNMIGYNALAYLKRRFKWEDIDAALASL